MLGRAEPLNVWLCARNLAIARRFYSDQLGLLLLREEPGEALHFGAGGAVISIHSASDGDLPPRGNWLVFNVPAGIDAKCEELKDRGIIFEQPLTNRPFGRSAMFRDPDGHELWICQPSATETQFFRWQQTQRVRPRPVARQRRLKVRRHERPAPSYRPAHPRD
jgi:predicted enzyme related to lactoylglutathione lyase